MKLHVCLENIRSAYNVGSVFRTSESAGIDTLYLTGYTAHPPHPKLAKTALGSQETITWQHHQEIEPLLNKLKRQSLQLIALEPLEDAISIYDLDFTQDTCLIFGNEVDGITQQTLNQTDITAKIPLFGTKESLNIASAAAITIYEYKRKLITKAT